MAASETTIPFGALTRVSSHAQTRTVVMSLPLFLFVFTTAPLMTMLFLWRSRARSALIVFPFAWILLSPIVTIGMQAYLLGSIVDERHCAVDPDGSFSLGEAWACPVGDALPTLLPGLINLVPLAWMTLPDRGARYAGFFAGLLGSLRFVVPLVIYARSAGSETFPERVMISQSGHYAENASLVASGFLWAVTLFTFAVVLIMMAQSRSSDSSGGPAAGSQTAAPASRSIASH